MKEGRGLKLAGRRERNAVREECANFSNGECAPRDGDCLVMLGKTCTYFEQCLRPVLNKSDSGRVCECGAILAHKERVCEKCRKKNRHQSYRSANARRRNEVEVQQLSENVLLQPVESQ